MANPLETGMTSPAAPNPDAGNPLQGGGAPQQAAMATAPNSAQTVAALRHFDAVKAEVGKLLSNPALGKSDVKGAIIDSTTRLVSERMLSPEQAVIQLSKVPADPLQQRKYLQQLMNQTVQAERAILAHHAVGFAGGGPEPAPSADSHMDHMSALAANYRQK